MEKGQIYVRLKDKAGSFYHAKLKVSLSGHTATLVPENDKKINLLLSNGALVRVDKVEALAQIKEAKDKVDKALDRDNARKIQRNAVQRGIDPKSQQKKEPVKLVPIKETSDSETDPEKLAEAKKLAEALKDPKSDASLEKLIEEGLDLEVLERKGHWYSFEGNAIDQGMPETVSKLQEDGELYLKILHAIEAKRT